LINYLPGLRQVTHNFIQINVREKLIFRVLMSGNLILPVISSEKSNSRRWRRGFDGYCRCIQSITPMVDMF